MKIEAKPEHFTISPATGTEDDWLIVTADGHIIGTGKGELDAIDDAIVRVSAIERELREYKTFKMGHLPNMKGWVIDG